MPHSRKVYIMLNTRIARALAHDLRKRGFDVTYKEYSHMSLVVAR